ncbi:LPXTG cell wall anchor domain-containing protein [Enterococcus phoeniculicola]
MLGGKPLPKTNDTVSSELPVAGALLVGLSSLGLWIRRKFKRD